MTAGWVPQILANLGRNDLYQIYQSNGANALHPGMPFNYDNSGNGNQIGPPGQTFIQYLDLMVCPSDTAKPMTAISATTTNLGTASQAPLSYAANAGCVDIIPFTSGGVPFPPDYQENAVFFNQASSVQVLPLNNSQPQQTPIKIDLAYIGRYDGTATTILFGENMDASFWAVYAGNGNASVPASFVPSYYFANPGMELAGAQVSQTNYEDPQALTWEDLPDQQPPATQPVLGLNQGLNGIQPGQLYAAGVIVQPGVVSRPSSPHPGGFHITFGDGHTMFMSQDVQYQIYAELMTPRGSCARPAASGPVITPAAAAATNSNPNPSVLLLQWQTAPISDSALNP